MIMVGNTPYWNESEIRTVINIRNNLMILTGMCLSEIEEE